MTINAKPALLFQSVFKDGLSLTATDTDADPQYDVANIIDYRQGTFWKAASLGTKIIEADMGSAVPVDSLFIISHNLGSASATVSVESSPGFSLSDPFDDSSFDTTKFASVLAGAGSVVETTSLAISAPLAADAALVYDKQILGERAFPWATRQKASLLAPGPTSVPVPFLALYQDAATPAVAAQAAFLSKVLADITQDTLGDIRFTYLDTSDVRWYWDGSDWQNTDDVAFAGAINTVYVTRLINDGVNLAFEIWDSTETTLHESASIPWTSVKAEADDAYICFGNPYTDQSAITIVLSLYEREGEAGGVYTNRIAGFNPSTDLAIFKTFTQVSVRYWRLKIVTGAIAPFLAVALLGERLEFERWIRGSFKPKPQTAKGETNTNADGLFINSVVASFMLKYNLNFTNLTPAWVTANLIPAIEAHLKWGLPFAWLWDIDNHPTDIYYVRVPLGTEIADQFDRSRQSFNLKMTGVTE
jgi:hypothetical protein